MKSKMNDLALLGGAPSFSATLPVGRPNVPRGRARARLMSQLAEILDRQWLTNHGPVVARFEQEIQRLTGVRHAIAVCNATQGLQVAARACGLTGEVIVPAFTFIATAHALSWIGLQPVFADVDPATHTLDPQRIEKLITPRTSGIVPTHLWGNPCAVEQLEKIARWHELSVIYDAAHAFGCSRGGRLIGAFGEAEVFSFHATKFINSGEGGAITTNDDELAARMRRMGNFGFEGFDRVTDAGTNAKMSEMAAALGLAGIEMMDEIIEINRKNYAAYQAGLDGLPGVRLLPHAQSERHNYQYVVIEIEADRAGLSRDQLRDVLWAEGIMARRYFHPGCHRMEPYLSQRAEGRLYQSLPVTERLAEAVLTLPTGASVGAGEIAMICQVICFALEHAHELILKLEGTARAAAFSGS
jgi:dTDP-4-amino-4,6-dideoxygalactose transaminase